MLVGTASILGDGEVAQLEQGALLAGCLDANWLASRAT